MDSTDTGKRLIRQRLARQLEELRRKMQGVSEEELLAALESEDQEDRSRPVGE